MMEGLLKWTFMGMFETGYMHCYTKSHIAADKTQGPVRKDYPWALSWEDKDGSYLMTSHFHYVNWEGEEIAKNWMLA